ERRRRAGGPEERLPERIDTRAVVDIGEVDAHLHDVARRAAGRLQDASELVEDEPRLLDGVVAADEDALRIDGEDARNEDEASGAYRVGGVRQLRAAGNTDLLAPAHGTSATHSISTFAPSTARRGASTSVDAGRVAPKTSWRTGLILGRSSTSV